MPVRMAGIGTGRGHGPVDRPRVRACVRVLCAAAGVSTLRAAFPATRHTWSGRCMRHLDATVVALCRALLPRAVLRAVSRGWRRAAVCVGLSHRATAWVLWALAWVLYYYGLACRRPRLTFDVASPSPLVHQVLARTPSLLRPFCPTPWAVNQHMQLALYVSHETCSTTNPPPPPPHPLFLGGLVSFQLLLWGVVCSVVIAYSGWMSCVCVC